MYTYVQFELFEIDYITGKLLTNQIYVVTVRKFRRNTHSRLHAV